MPITTYNEYEHVKTIQFISKTITSEREKFTTELKDILNKVSNNKSKDEEAGGKMRSLKLVFFLKMCVFVMEKLTLFGF